MQYRYSACEQSLSVLFLILNISAQFKQFTLKVSKFLEQQLKMQSYFRTTLQFLIAVTFIVIFVSYHSTIFSRAPYHDKPEGCKVSIIMCVPTHAAQASSMRH